MTDPHPLSCRHETRLDRREARKAEIAKAGIYCYGGEYHVVQIEPRQVISSHDTIAEASAAVGAHNSHVHDDLCCCRDCLVVIEDRRYERESPWLDTPGRSM